MIQPQQQELLDPVDIFVDPAIGVPGSDVKIFMRTTSGVKINNLSISAICDNGSEILSLDVVDIDRDVHWTLPEDANGIIHITLMHEGTQIDEAILEVYDEDDASKMDALNEAIDSERKSLSLFEEDINGERIVDIVSSIIQAAEKYKIASNEILAARCLRQLALQILNRNQGFREMMRPCIRELIDLSYYYARASGDYSEIIRSLHLLSSPEYTDDPNESGTFLARADQLLREVNSSETLLHDHYRIVAKLLDSSSQLALNTAAFVRLTEIAKDGLYFALLSKERNVRQSCLEYLLPSYRDIFFKHARFLNIEVDQTITEKRLRLGQVQLNSSLENITHPLSPDFSKAILAGVNSFANFALRSVEPSVQMKVLVLRQDKVELFKIAALVEGSPWRRLSAAASSWLKSPDGIYYKKAICLISCEIIDSHDVAFNNWPESLIEDESHHNNGNNNILYGVQRNHMENSAVNVDDVTHRRHSRRSDHV